MKKRRPILIWVILLLFLLLGWEGFVRVWQTAAQRSTLAALKISVSPVYLAVSGAIWLAGGWIPAAALWFRRRWAVAAGFAGVLTASVSYWADRLFLSADTSHQENILFSSSLTAFLMCLILGTLALRITRDYLENK